MANIKIDQNKIKKAVMDKARNDISSRNFSVACPHCNAQVSIPAGKSPCPICGEDINLNLDFKF